MKLHLPSGLRAALFACFAAFAGIGTTLSTATIAGGVFAVAIAGQSVYAADYIGAADIDGTKIGYKSADGSVSGLLNDTSLTSADTITYSGVSGWLPLDSQTYNANIKLEGDGLNIVDGSPGRIYEFNGALSGSGNFTVGTKQHANRRHLFKGDVSGFTGAFSIIASNNANPNTLEFINESGRAREVNASSITVANVLKFTGDYTVANTVSAGTLKVEDGALVLNGSDSEVTNLTVNQNASLTLGGTASLTLNGAVTGLAGSVNNGTVTFGDNAMVTLDDSLFTEETDGTYTLALFTGSGSMSGLTVDKLDGILTAGREYTFNSNGTISYTITSQMLSFTGGELAWNVGAEMTGGQFADGDIVTFTGDTVATMGAPLSAAIVTVEDGVTLSLSNGGVAENTLSSEALIVNGTLTVKDAVLAADTRVHADSTGTVVINAAASENIDIQAQLADFSGTLNVQSGRYVLNTAKATPFSSLNVKEGGQLDLTTSYAGAISLEGHGTGGDWRDTALRLSDGNTISGKVTIEDAGSSIAVNSGDATISGELAGSGDLKKTEGGTLYLTGNITNTGTLNIQGGKVSIGSGPDQTNSMSFSNINVGANCTLQFQHAGANFSGTDITLNGDSTLHMQDSNCGNTVPMPDPESKAIALGKLTLTGDATISWTWKGAFSFTELTGNGNLALSGEVKGNDPRATVISSINNYNGTISGEPAKHVLYLGSVHQDEAYSAVIKETNTIYTSSFSKTGAGDLVIVNDLAISGTLTMNYEGGLFYNEAKGDAYAGLSIASVADGTILSYTKATGLLTLDAAAVGESTLYLDLLGVADSLATGINLGIANTVAESQLVIGGISGGTLSQKDGSWWYTGGAIDTPWDINWGTAQLATAPATVPVKGDVSGSITLGDTDAYHTEGSKTSAILITGTQEAGAFIYGGYDNAGNTTSRTAEFDSWIKMTGGDVFQIVGGNNCSAWQNSSAHHFKGDSHILIEASGDEGATDPVVDYIIGGNYKDGYGTTFTGDSFISIKSNSLQGAVAGGNAQAHGSTATFVGDSHIYIYTPQTLTADTDWVASGNGRLQTVDAIIGGNVKIANVHGTLVFNGDTNIVLDFDGFTEEATMAKAIIGGSYNGAGTTTHTGNTNITIRNADTTTFSKNIVGGSWMGGNTSTISGTATVDISSGIFTGTIVGGHYASTANSNYSIGGVEMNLSGGTYKGDIYAAGYLNTGASTVTTGSTTVTIGSGATLGADGAAITVSGGFGGAGTGGTVTGERLLNLSGGTFAHATFKDFDKVNTADSTVTTATFELAESDTLTKVGAGTLSLNGGTTACTMKVQEGTLALNGQTLTATTVAGGATLDGSVAGSNAGALTLDGTVKLDAGENGIALGSLTLAAGAKIEVLGVDSLGEDYTLTLFTGLSQDKITGITFTTVDDAIKANLADYVSNADAFVGGEIYLNEDGSLVITNGGPGGVWKWDTPGDAGEWKADSEAGWETGAGTTTEGAKVAFGKDGLEGVDSTTVTISGEVKPATVTVDTAEGKSYIFEAEAEGSGIAAGTLEKTGAGTLVLETANSSTGAMTVTEGTVQIGTATTGTTVGAAGDWAGDIAVNGTSVLDVQNVADGALGTITAEAGATVKVADDVTISALNGGKLENSAALTLGAASTLDTLDNAGSITTGNNAITVGTVTNGGSLDAQYATVTLGSDATFSKLSAGAVNAGDTKLTLTGDSTVDTIGGDYKTQVAITGGETVVRTGGVWTKLESVQLSDTGSSLLNLTASVEIAGSVTTGAAAAGSAVLADNAGLVSDWNIRVGTINEGTATEGDANVAIVGNLKTTYGGIYVRGNVDVDKTADDTFGDVTAGSVINIGGAAAVEGTLTAGQDAAIGGAATVGGDLKSTGAAVTVVGDATVGGALDGFASVTVGGKATVGGNVASKGAISISGAADVDGSVTSQSGPVIIGGVATIGGSVSAAGNVTLDAGGTIGDTAAGTGDLTLSGTDGGTLALGGTVVVGGTVSGVTQISVADSALAPAATAPVLEAKAWTGGALTMAFESKQSVLNLGIKAGDFYTLLTTTDIMDDPLALTLVAPAEAGIATLADEDATSFTENAIRYSLVQSDDKFSVRLTATYVGKDWVSTDGTWTTDEAGKADWSSTEVPGADADVVFNGKGTATVSVDDVVSVQSITIDTAANAATTGTAAYTFTSTDDSTVTTQVLSVVTGGLTLDGAVIDAGATSVGRVAGDTDATLAVGEGSTLNATSLQVHGVTGEDLGFSNAGTVAVSGMLTVTDKDKTLVNSGALSFGDASALGKVNNTGTLTATAGTSTVDELVAVGNLAATGDAVLNITAVTGSIGSVTLADSSVISVGGSAGDAVLNVAALSGSPDSTFSTTRALALGSATTQGGHVEAASLDLTNASGSTLASLKTDALTLNMGAFDGNALLTITGKPATGSAIALTLTGMDNAATTFTYDNVGNLGTYGSEDVVLADGSTYTREWTTYTLVNAVAGYDWTLDTADLQQLFALAGTYATVEFKEGDVFLSIYKDEPRDWVSSNPDWAGNETNNDGEVLDVTKIAGTYTDFDTVDAVKLDGQNAIIDLTDRVDANNVLSNATDVTKGVVLRDVQGEGNLYLMGDAATGADKDLVTLSHLKDGGTELKGQLFGNSIAIQVEGAGTNTGLTVDSIELWESSVLTVLGTGNLTSVGAANLDKSSVIVQDGGSLTIEGDTKVKNGVLEAHSGAQITAGAVTLADADAALIAADGAVVSISSLNGTTGTVIGSVTITGKGGNYSGGYVDATLGLNGAQQTLAAKSGLSLLATGADATLTCTGADAAVDSLHTLDSKVTLDNVAGGVMNTLSLGETSSMQNGELAFGVKAMDVANAANYGVQAPVITDGAALNLSGTKLTVTQADTEVQRTTFDTSLGTEDITLMTVSADGSMDGVTVSFGENDKFFSRYFENIEVKDGKVIGDLITDRYSRDLAQTDNGTVGLQMMDAADLALNPMGMNDTVGDSAEYADLAGILHSLEGFKSTGDADGADKLGAAVAGSGVASLGMALAGDVERQLRAIRNRTTTMGVDPAVVNDDMPYFNAWINAEGDHRSLDEDSTLSGYSLSSWGGTVGFDMDVNPSLTWGLAVTAMYGDFTSESADQVEGDVNTYYVSAFARATSGAWVHTFVATMGMSKSELERTVSHSGGSYTTEGEADGMSFGFLYEVGRTFALNEDATACWQPVFNVSYRHTEVDAFSESGSDAALECGDQSLDTLTFGLGGRLQAIVGENIYNRTSILEARALVKLDAGDRQSEMNTALSALPSAAGTVKSAEMDAFGIEVGAGLTVPMGIDSGSIFMDASVEFRGSYTSVNGTLGYRINF